MFNSKQEFLKQIRLGEDSLLELKEAQLDGYGLVDRDRNSLAGTLTASANRCSGVCLLSLRAKFREVGRVFMRVLRNRMISARGMDPLK